MHQNCGYFLLAIIIYIIDITNSGYLSAKKIRSKFHSLVANVIEKHKYSGVRLSDNPNEVIIIIKEAFQVHVSPAFSWKGKKNSQPSTCLFFNFNQFHSFLKTVRHWKYVSFLRCMASECRKLGGSTSTSMAQCAGSKRCYARGDNTSVQRKRIYKK